MSATEVARNFSDVLNRVAAGEQVEIVRNGAPVALLAPARGRLIPAERFRELVATAPPVDPGFAGDVRELRARFGPPRDKWPS